MSYYDAFKCHDENLVAQAVHDVDIGPTTVDWMQSSAISTVLDMLLIQPALLFVYAFLKVARVNRQRRRAKRLSEMYLASL